MISYELNVSMKGVYIAVQVDHEGEPRKLVWLHDGGDSPRLAIDLLIGSDTGQIC